MLAFFGEAEDNFVGRGQRRGVVDFVAVVFGWLQVVFRVEEDDVEDGGFFVEETRDASETSGEGELPEGIFGVVVPVGLRDGVEVAPSDGDVRLCPVDRVDAVGFAGGVVTDDIGILFAEVFEPVEERCEPVRVLVCELKEGILLEIGEGEGNLLFFLNCCEVGFRVAGSQRDLFFPRATG